MNEIILRPKRPFRRPVFASCIRPDLFEGRGAEEIEGLEVWEGNRRKTLGELFRVEEARTGGDGGEVRIRILGDVSRVRMIGLGMERGEIIIQGDVGFHLGEGMRGGRIAVHGSAGSWAGSMMRGGTIEIYGNAGDYVGAPYRGANRGMRGGTILIHGSVGRELGAYMVKGLIKVFGNVGDFVGFRMRGGTIFVGGDAGGRAGACMTGGKIVVDGRIESILPSFTIEDVRPKVKVNGEVVAGPFYLFVGDITEEGKGRLYVSKPKNPHLSPYEKYLT